jgi:Zn-dependent peptidase ImmA (M78 family)
MDCPFAWAEWAAGQLLQDARQVAVPVDLSPMLVARKSTIIGFDRRLPCEARLETGPAGFLIRLNGSLASDENESRRRFALAHELGHTLFYDLNELPPVRIICLPLHDPVEEEVCDKFAAALLVPNCYLQSLCREVASRGDGLTLLDRICAECRVPRSVATLRLRQELPGLEHDWLSAIASG